MLILKYFSHFLQLLFQLIFIIPIIRSADNIYLSQTIVLICFLFYKKLITQKVTYCTNNNCTQMTHRENKCNDMRIRMVYFSKQVLRKNRKSQAEHTLCLTHGNIRKEKCYLLMVAFSASIEVSRPASTDMVRSSISRDT